jgi:hypothetical protein
VYKYAAIESHDRPQDETITSLLYATQIPKPNHLYSLELVNTGAFIIFLLENLRRTEMAAQWSPPVAEFA